MDAAGRRALKRQQNSVINHMAAGLILYSALSVGFSVLLYLLLISQILPASFYPLYDRFFYLTAIAGVLTGLLFLYLFYRRLLPPREILTVRKRMSLHVFFRLLCIFSAAQFVSSMADTFLEFCLNIIGFSSASSLETATSTSTDITMFLYACLVAPVAEELVYRGFCLRFTERYGKIFCIVFSALMFAIMHANLPQGLFAFLVGLILAYVTVEYAIHYAILLHFINNFVYGDLLDFLLRPLSAGAQNLSFFLIFGAFTLAALVILLMYRRHIRAYVQNNRSAPYIWRHAFSALLVVIFILMHLIPAVLSLDAL